MSNHTPGPWTWREHAPYSVWCGDTQIAAGRVYERLGTLVEIAPYFEPDNERAQANARLIAAAPEMRELLERLLSPGGWAIADWTSVRALLAKIEGKES